MVGWVDRHDGMGTSTRWGECMVMIGWIHRIVTIGCVVRHDGGSTMS